MKLIKDKYEKLRQRGLTLIEAAMVLAISTLVIAGIMVFFQSASINAKTNEAMSQLNSLRTTINSLYAGQPTYQGLSNELLINSSGVPSKMVSGTDIISAFSSPVIVSDVSVSMGTSNAYSVSFTDVPSEACVAMATKDLGNGVVSLDITGTSIMLDPISIADVNMACNGGGPYNLLWTFR